MTTPTYSEWRANSSPTQDGLNDQTIFERIIAALAAFVTQQNPDGTAN